MNGEIALPKTFGWGKLDSAGQSTWDTILVENVDLSGGGILEVVFVNGKVNLDWIELNL